VAEKCTASARRGLAGLGRLQSLGRIGAPGLFLFFCSNYFSFSVFETKSFVLQQNLHRFESLQICKICKMGQRVFELNKTQTRRKSKRKDFRRNKIGSPNLFDQF
jgi:hypothetical protein